MMWFWPPVRVNEIATSYTYEVKSVEVCIEQMESWPTRGPKWRRAYKTCFDALEGMAEASDARKAFESAAKEAGVLQSNPD